MSVSNWNLKVLVFKERGKPKYPEKNLSEQGREPTTNSTHIWRWRQDSNPDHIGGRRVLSPLRHPCSPRVVQERYSRNTNMFQLCRLIFQDLPGATIMSSSSMHCVANKQQSLIDKGFAKSRPQIYELISLHYKICRIASLWYLFNSVLITNFSHTWSKASLILRILRSGPDYVLQKSVNGLWLVNVNVGCV